MYKVKGSGIVWAVCILAVLVIIITGVLGIAQIKSSRTIDETKKQQAEFSAVSAIELVADDIQSEKNHDAWLNLLWNDVLYMPNEQEKRIENLQFEGIDAGNISLVFNWESMEREAYPYTMTLTAESEYYGEYEEISAVFQFTDEKKWVLVKYIK